MVSDDSCVGSRHNRSALPGLPGQPFLPMLVSGLFLFLRFLPLGIALIAWKFSNTWKG